MNPEELAALTQQSEDRSKLWNELAAQTDSDSVEPSKAPVAADEKQDTTDATSAPAANAPVAAPAATGADAAAAAAPDDELTRLRDTVAGLAKQNTELLSRVRNAEGHIGGLRNDLARRPSTQPEAPTTEQVKAAAGDADAMAKLKEEYPEFGAHIDAALKAELTRRDVDTKRMLDELRATIPSGVSAEEFNKAMREMPVEAAHPGWKRDVKSPEFSGWLQRQAKEVAALAESDEPSDAIQLIGLYRAARAPATPAVPNNPTKRLESAARLPSGRSSVAPATKDWEQMSRSEQWAAAAKETDARIAASGP